MKVITPTPSQAAFAMKKFFASQGIEMKLGQAQEAFAISQGFSSWNVLVTEHPAREKLVAKPSIADVAPYLGFEGMQLWSITCRISGDDDDSQYLKWGNNAAEAIEAAAWNVWLDDGLPDDEAIFHRERDVRVYHISEELVGSIVAGQFVFKDGLAPSATFDADIAAPVVVGCLRCASALEKHGVVDYCSDSTCPYHDWPQTVPYSAMTSMSKLQIQMKYGAVKRIPDEEGTLSYFIEEGEHLRATNSDSQADMDGLAGKIERVALATGLFSGWTRQPGRDEGCMEKLGPFVQVSFDQQLSERFVMEVVLTLREEMMDAYVRTWEYPKNDARGGEYRIFDERSGDYDTNADRPDSDQHLRVLIENAMKEVKAHKRSLRDTYTFD